MLSSYTPKFDRVATRVLPEDWASHRRSGRWIPQRPLRGLERLRLTPPRLGGRPGGASPGWAAGGGCARTRRPGHRANPAAGAGRTRPGPVGGQGAVTGQRRHVAGARGSGAGHDGSAAPISRRVAEVLPPRARCPLSDLAGVPGNDAVGGPVNVGCVGDGLAR